MSKRVLYSRQTSLKEYLEKRSAKRKNGCIEWLYGKDKDGYGQVGSTIWKRKCNKSRTHQVAYIAHVGPIPKGKLVCHKCDNTSCINPKHLFLGTWNDNVQDMMRKGRYVSGGNKRTIDYKEVMKYKGKLNSFKTSAIFGVSFGRICSIWRGEYANK